MKEFEARGVRVVGVSVDAPEVTRRHAQKQGYTYAFLSDEKREVIRRYDTLHAKAGPGESDIARPAEFLIDPAGTIRWVNLTEDWRVRARPDEVLRVFDGLRRAGSMK
ncbi:MAG: redoxin domain-containing protein [Acidobacteria bacterium]|nr:redoxin domain-containing protein [Acidobacteriota bacterium]MBI3655307.1 redoxin domain-containing protein [Acidobacteriota bacterium]